MKWLLLCLALIIPSVVVAQSFGDNGEREYFYTTPAQVEKHWQCIDAGHGTLHLRCDNCPEWANDVQRLPIDLYLKCDSCSCAKSAKSDALAR